VKPLLWRLQHFLVWKQKGVFASLRIIKRLSGDFYSKIVLLLYAIGTLKIFKIKFREYGFIVIRKLFSEEEMKLLCKCFENQEFRNKMFTRSNGEKNGFQMALWWEPGDDTAGVMSRCKRVVKTMIELLGGKELYLLSSKLIAKDPEVGGAFAWHQDYGYFYENGVLYPDCGSVSIPLHKCYK